MFRSFDPGDIAAGKLSGPGRTVPRTAAFGRWFEGAGTGATPRRYLSADERGSGRLDHWGMVHFRALISVGDSSGASLAINSYDEYGIPAFGALADQRFGYTGQAWLPSVGLWYYKARIYAPQIGGRFLQPDPVGYWDSPNLYAYVGNDPVNFVDPLGLTANEIIVTGILPIDPNYSFGMGGLFGGMASAVGGTGEPLYESGEHPEVVVTRRRLARHRYVNVWRITQQSTQCTFDQARQAVMDNFVPFRRGNNVSGRQYDVAPRISRTAPDTITFRQLSSTTFVNVTEPDHYLRFGSVRGTLIGDQQIGFMIQIVGSGTNVSEGRARFNKWFGRNFFAGQAQLMNQQLLSMCGG